MEHTSWYQRPPWGACFNWVGAEFTWKSFTFSYETQEDFVQCQWRPFFRPWLFTAYRVTLVTGLLIWLLLDIPIETNAHFDGRTAIWFTYATNWAFLATVLTHFLLATCALIHNCPPPKDDIEPRRVALYQLIWLLYTISINSVIVVCLVFWIALVNLNLALFDSTSARVKHSLMTGLCLLDLSFSAIPIRLLHWVYPVLLGLTYSLFTYLDWLAGGAQGQIYPGLDWARPRQAGLLCFLLLILSSVIHIGLFILYTIRRRLSDLVVRRCLLQNRSITAGVDEASDRLMVSQISLVSTSAAGADEVSGYGAID